MLKNNIERIFMIKFSNTCLLKQTVIISSLFVLLLVNISLSQSIQPKDVVSIKAYVVKDSANTGGLLSAEVILNIKDGWHINANKPLDDYLTPTEIVLKDSSDFVIKKIKYPPPQITRLSFSDTELALYENGITIRLSLKEKDVKKAIPDVIKFELQYQPCNNQTCLFPVAKSFAIKTN